MNFIVNGAIWKIKFVPKTNKNLMRSDGTMTIGVADSNTKTVYMAERMPENLKRKVFMHELVHVFCMEYLYQIPIFVEEIVADFVSLYGTDIIYITDNIFGDLIIGVA